MLTFFTCSLHTLPSLTLYACSLRKVQAEWETAVREDATVFQYDEVYDDMEQAKTVETMRRQEEKSADKRPKYERTRTRTHTHTHTHTHTSPPPPPPTPPLPHHYHHHPIHSPGTSTLSWRTRDARNFKTSCAMNDKRRRSASVKGLSFQTRTSSSHQRTCPRPPPSLDSHLHPPHVSHFHPRPSSLLLSPPLSIPSRPHLHPRPHPPLHPHWRSHGHHNHAYARTRARTRARAHTHTHTHTHTLLTHSPLLLAHLCTHHADTSKNLLS
jgi:hypothetical protein